MTEIPKIEVVREHYRIQREKQKAARDRYLSDRYEAVRKDQAEIRRDIGDQITYYLNEATERGEPITYIIYRRWKVHMDEGTTLAMMKIFGPELEAAGYEVMPVDGGLRIDWLIQVQPDQAADWEKDKVLP